jgi:hypothetical protein
MNDENDPQLINRLVDIVKENKQINISPYKIGRFYFIRTVTHYLTGELTFVGDKELVLKSAAWIAETGRYANAIEDAEFLEVEPYPDREVIVGRGAIIDAIIIASLPREQK